MNVGYKTKARTGSALVVILGILSIELIGRSADPISLVPISTMVSEVFLMFSTGEIMGDLQVTLIQIVAAFLLSTATGILLGSLLWYSEYLHDVLEPYLIAYYAVPVYALYAVFIAIFGIGLLPVVITAWLLGFIFIAVNTAEGLNRVPEIYKDVGHSLNLSRWQMAKNVYLPASAPYVFTGLKLGFIFCMIGVIATEFIIAGAGIGNATAIAYESYNTERMYALILLILAFALIINFVLSGIENYLYQRGTE